MSKGAEPTEPAAGGEDANEELARKRAELERFEQELWATKEQLVAHSERMRQIEADLDAARSERDEAERQWQASVEWVQAIAAEIAQTARAQAESNERAARSTDSGNNGDQMEHVLRALEEIDAIEAGVQMELAHLDALEQAISTASYATMEQDLSGVVDPDKLEQLERSLELKDQELQLALMDVDRVRSEYEDRERALRSKLAAPPTVPDKENRPLNEEVVNRKAEAILLYTIIANHRRHAGKLREELESHRARVGKLSAAEIAGFLDEIGNGLTDFEK